MIIEVGPRGQQAELSKISGQFIYKSRDEHFRSYVGIGYLRNHSVALQSSTADHQSYVTRGSHPIVVLAAN